MQPYKIILGKILNPLSDRRCQWLEQGALCLKKDKSGAYKIVELGTALRVLRKYPVHELVDYRQKLVMPAFYDMHFHWVQDDVRLMPKKSLLNWLSEYTWPAEAKFKSAVYSQKRAKEFAKHLLSVGTIGGGCFASIHGHTVDLALKYFVGDFVVGNVLMTMNSPDYLIQTPQNALQLMRTKASRFKERYAVTPRFAITVDLEVMKKGGQIAKRNRSFIQTHLSENKKEIAFVLSLKEFRGIESYTEIYHKAGILGRKTVMAHCIHLTAKELELLSKTQTAIAHCPSSNAPVKKLGLGSGLFDFRRVEKKGIRWALASDIGGGPYLSMLDVMRSFVTLNRGNPQATFVKALYRSTLAGAEILGIDKHNGNFLPGKYANFVVMEMPKLKGKLSSEAILRQLIMGHSRSDYQQLHLATIYRGQFFR